MSTYRELLQTCNRLNRQNIPGWCLEPEQQGTNHWSGTLDVMRESLGRPLTDAEITLLSLSRAYGPCPSLPDSIAARVIAHLWPHGNSQGLRIDWADLAVKLRSLPFQLV